MHEQGLLMRDDEPMESFENLKYVKALYRQLLKHFFLKSFKSGLGTWDRVTDYFFYYYFSFELSGKWFVKYLI